MRIALIALALATVGLSSPALSQTFRAGSVTMVRTGWNAEPIVNPGSCTSADGYISEKSFPGYSTYYAAAVTALTTRRRVIVVVHDSECWAGRPKLIGINLTSD